MVQIRKVGQFARGRATALSAALVLLMVSALASATTYTAQYDTTGLVSQLNADIQGAASGLFPVMVGALGLVVGWRYIRRFGKSV